MWEENGRNRTNTSHTLHILHTLLGTTDGYHGWIWQTFVVT